MLVPVTALLMQPAGQAINVSPDPPAVPQNVDAQRLAQARWLVDLFHPEATMIASNMAMWSLRVRRSAQHDPAMAKIDREYSGAINAYLAGAQPVALDNATAFVRRAKARKAAVLAANLSGADLQRVIAFFRSSVGAKVMRLEQRPGAIAKIARRAPTGSGPYLTPVDTENDRQGQVKQAVDGLSSDELIEVMKFQSDPVAVRYAKAVRLADAELLRIVNNPDPMRLASEYEAGTRALDAHIAALKKKSGG